MPVSTDVKLPRDTEPKWPDRCVCCGRPGPGGRVRVWTAAIGWWTLLGKFGALYSVKVPACAPCGRRLWIKRLAGLILTALLAFVAVAAARWILESYQGPMRKWLGLIVALICLSPFFLWGVFFPPAFDITCFAETVDFEFRDPAYAAEFEAMNRGATVGD